jgi:hypothetical protein
MKISLYAADPDSRGRLAPAVRTRWHDDGAVLVRNLIPAAALQRVFVELERLVSSFETRHDFPAPRGHGARRLGARIAALADEAPFTPRLIEAAMNDAPSLHAVAADPRLLAAIHGLLPPPVQIDALEFRVLLPETHEAAEMAGSGRGTALADASVIVPLQALDWSNGAPVVALGSHAARARKAPRPSLDTVVDDSDALIVHPELACAIGANRSDDAVLMIVMHYRRLALFAANAA